MESRELPARPNLDQYKKQAKELLKALQAQDSQAMERMRRSHPHAREVTEPGLADAQLLLAREHGFESWPKFARCIHELNQANSPVAEFERAVDTVINGDAGTLREMLRGNPVLVRTRSRREHRATLLHYVAANGVEDYRQKTPKNAVEIAAVLLDAGAEVDAVAEVYGKSTTLGLAATSIHPLRAGVLIPLLELLLERGASVEGAPGGGSIVNACLANGRRLASEFLASRGAKLDLEGAAGIGRIDLVRNFIGPDRSLQPNTTRQQMESGFIWACEYGRAEVADFLLEMGVDPNACRQHRLTGLHWAAASGDAETVRAVLKHKPPLEVRNVWGGTPLASAIWAAIELNDSAWSRADWIPILEALLQAGADVRAVEYPTGDAGIDETLRRYRGQR